MPTPLFGTGNVGISNTEVGIRLKLDEAVRLRLGAVRVNGGKPAALGALSQRDKGRFIMEECFNRGLRVLFQFVIKPSELNDPDVTIENLQDGGYLWGQAVSNSPFRVAVIGFAPQNEFDQDVLEALDGEGEAAAAAVAATHAEVVRSFCQGVRAAPGDWPATAKLMPGGMANPESEAAVIALAPLVPDLLPGTGGVPPLLDGIALHWYKPDTAFTLSVINYEVQPPPPGSPLWSATLNGSSLAGRTDILITRLRDATDLDLPYDTPIFVLECNVQRATFNPPGEPEGNEKTKAALRTLLNGVFADERVELAFTYSPWIPNDTQHQAAYRNYLISFDDPATPLIPDDPTPACAVVLEITFPPGGGGESD